MAKRKKKGFDVGKKVRHISREVFAGKLPTTKEHRDKTKFSKSKRQKGKYRRMNHQSDHSSFFIYKKNL